MEKRRAYSFNNRTNNKFLRASKPDSVVAEALEDYKNKKLTTEDIAIKHKICAATLTVWAKKAGLPLRTRGRRELTAPTPRHLKILEMATVLKYDQIASKLGTHKQAVHRIVKRWKDYARPSRAPFAPGDVLLWGRKRLTVRDATVTEGTLVDEDGKIYKHFPWAGGKLPKKIGTNPRYAAAA